MVISSTVWVRLRVGGGGLGLGEVEACDLEAAEEEAGAARVDVIARDPLWTGGAPSIRRRAGW